MNVTNIIFFCNVRIAGGLVCSAVPEKTAFKSWSSIQKSAIGFLLFFVFLGIYSCEV